MKKLTVAFFILMLSTMTNVYANHCGGNHAADKVHAADKDQKAHDDHDKKDGHDDHDKKDGHDDHDKKDGQDK